MTGQIEGFQFAFHGCVPAHSEPFSFGKAATGDIRWRRRRRRSGRRSRRSLRAIIRREISPDTCRVSYTSMYLYTCEEKVFLIRTEYKQGIGWRG